MTSEQLIKRWMFYHCPKQHSWIVYQNLTHILEGTNYLNSSSNLTNPDQIYYIHSISMDDNHLLCLLETLEGYFLIENHRNQQPDDVDSDQVDSDQVDKQKDKITSTTTFFSTLEEFLNQSSRKVQRTLGIKKLHLMELTKDQQTRKLYPFDYPRMSNLNIVLDQEVKDGVLDLSWNFFVKSEDLLNWNPPTNLTINKLIFNTCFQIKDFKWVDTEWVKRLRTLEMINLNQLTNRNVEYLVTKMTNLKELYLHFCPQINIRVLLGVLKSNTLSVLCLDDPRMVCQPNVYSGMITDDEWRSFKNYGLKRLLLNSQNLSLDIIDYLRNSCVVLENLIICDEKYQFLRKNLINNSSDPSSRSIMISCTGGRQMQLSRDFMIKNLLKHQNQSPFSESMLRIMEQIYQEEQSEQNDIHQIQ